MYQERYEKKKKILLADKSINEKNRRTMGRFLEHQEYRLKRRNGLPQVDERSYKTLDYFLGRLRNINAWFGNKEWAALKKADIKKMIDDLEDGVIKTVKGERFKDRSLYYQMIQGKLFALVGKDQDAKEFIKEHEIIGRKNDNQVRFTTEQDFRKIVDCAITPEQRCLLWLAFDIGENIGSLLELEKHDFQRQVNENTREPEYLVILSKDKLKRSRTPRSETTNYAETVRYLDIILSNLKPSERIVSNRFMKNKHLGDLHNPDKLFKFSETAATRFLRRAVEKSGVRCQPEGQNVAWKDLRSSMSCDLLKKGWTRDEVNARLGHKPSSRIIDRYINFLALDRNRPKQKVHESNLRKLESDLENTKDLSKLQALRIAKQQEELEQLKVEYDKKLQDIIEELNAISKGAQKAVAR